MLPTIFQVIHNKDSVLCCTDKTEDDVFIYPSVSLIVSKVF